jgi:secondary thiamine-phosphate synthase enzyme
MAVAADKFTISFETRGDIDVIDITSRVREGIASQSIRDGLATVFVPGATGAVTTIEFEPGLVQDIKDLFAGLAPPGGQYNHDATSPTGNAHSHLGASLLGPSVSVPFEDGELMLGQWQQIVFVDFDNRPRSRQLIVRITG